MSDIQTLIQTVQAENLQNRAILSNTETYNDLMVELLTDIRLSIVSIKDNLFDFFDAEQQRYEESRLAAIERMREQSRDAETTKPLSTTPAASDDGFGLLGGLGIGGLVAGLGVAAAGYFTGLTKALANGLAAVTKMITPKAFTAPFTNFFNKLKFFARALSDVFKGRQSTFAIKQFGTFSKTLADLGAKFQKALQPIKNFFAPLGELSKLFPSGGGKFVEGIKAFGSKLGGIFKLFSKIAVPITAIIATVQGILGSFEEFNDDMSFFDKTMIVIKNLFKEIASSFVTMPLELIKDGISAIAGWLGFDGVEEYLDSFDIDQMFRDSIDSFFSWIDDAITDIGDFFYQAKRKFGGAIDPEAEARIAAREVGSAQENLAEADTRVQQAQSAVDTAANANERREAEEKLQKALQVRDARAKDLQQAQQSAAERRTAAGLPTLDVPATQAAPEPPPPPSDLFQVMNAQGEVTNQFSTYEEAAAAAAELGGGAYAMANPNPTPAEEKTIAATEKTADATETLVEKATEKGSLYVHDIHVEKAITPLVEAMSSYTNTVTGGNQTINNLDNVTSSPMLLGQVAAAQNGILAAPVGRASREIQGQSSAPIVISSTQGGSTVNNMVNNNSTTVMGGGASARSSDVSHRRLQDRMQGI